ncbi:MAG TPA: GNAT family N-acetyltransferase [Candidatus Obscuribacterales bacterium]
MESKITLPKARSLDVSTELERIVPLLKLLPGGTNSDNLRLLKSEICRIGTAVYVIDASSGPVAMITLSQPYLRRVGLIEHIAVMPDYRRQRLASILYEYVERLAFDLGLLRLCIIATTTDGMSFAMAQGFSTQALLPPYLGVGRNVVWLDKDISQLVFASSEEGASRE